MNVCGATPPHNAGLNKPGEECEVIWSFNRREVLRRRELCDAYRQGDAGSTLRVLGELPDGVHSRRVQKGYNV
jgi:hypothetical protein